MAKTSINISIDYIKSLETKQERKALAMVVTLKLAYNNSVFWGGEHPWRRIAQTFHCSQHTAKLAVLEAVRLGLISIDKDNVFRCANICSKYAEVRYTRRRKETIKYRGLNIVHIEFEKGDIRFSDVKKEIEDAYLLHDFRAAIYKENKNLDLYPNRSSDNPSGARRCEYLSYDAIAAKHGISKRTASQRVKRLERRGLLHSQLIPLQPIAHERDYDRNDRAVRCCIVLRFMWVRTAHYAYSIDKKAVEMTNYTILDHEKRIAKNNNNFEVQMMGIDPRNPRVKYKEYVSRGFTDMQ